MSQTTSNSILDHRKQFSALSNKTYMNFGGQGTIPSSSIDSIMKNYLFVQESGPFNAAMFTWLDSEQDATRAAFAAELGGDSTSFALTQNATDGCNMVLWGLDWQPGDHLLTTDCEHVGVAHAVMQLQRRRGIDLTFCKLSEAKSKQQMVEIIERAITDRTRMLLISHVLWNTGEALPVPQIAEVCRSRNVLLLIDGAQSAGALDLDLSTACGGDFYAITGHKWICGPEGVGSLYIAPQALERIQPTFVGWRGSTMDFKTGLPTGFNANASRFEVGTVPIELLAGLRNSLETHRRFGTAKERQELLFKNANRLIALLSEIKGVKCILPQAESGLVSFSIAGSNNRDTVAKLDARRIYVRTIPFPDCLRASVHYFTSEAEIDTLVAALREIVSG